MRHKIKYNTTVWSAGQTIRRLSGYVFPCVLFWSPLLLWLTHCLPFFFTLCRFMYTSNTGIFQHGGLSAVESHLWWNWWCEQGPSRYSVGIYVHSLPLIFTLMHLLFGVYASHSPRVGHQQTVDKILAWLEADGVKGETICDAGCGVGSLAIPMAQLGAKVHET